MASQANEAHGPLSRGDVGCDCGYRAGRHTDMRLCVVSQEYPPDTSSGGIGTQTYIKAHGLAARGHEVSVIAASQADVRSECWDGPVRVIRMPGCQSRMRLNTEPVR